jgi:hypothetical protein
MRRLVKRYPETTMMLAIFSSLGLWAALSALWIGFVYIGLVSAFLFTIATAVRSDRKRARQ